MNSSRFTSPGSFLPSRRDASPVSATASRLPSTVHAKTTSQRAWRKNTAKYSSPAREPHVPGAGSFIPSGPSVATVVTNFAGNRRGHFGSARLMSLQHDPPVLPEIRNARGDRQYRRQHIPADADPVHDEDRRIVTPERVGVVALKHPCAHQPADRVKLREGLHLAALVGLDHQPLCRRGHAHA